MSHSLIQKVHWVWVSLSSFSYFPYNLAKMLGADTINLYELMT